MESPDSQRSSAPTGTFTSSELLAGLRDSANQTVWSDYVDRYRPMIVRAVRRSGLTEADAEDVAQSSLLDFSRAYLAGEYDRERGRLRDWLFGIVRNRVRNARRAGGRDPVVEGAGDGAAEPIPEGDHPAAPDQFERIWEEEWRAAVLRQCSAIVRGEVQPTTYAAFQGVVVHGRPVPEVAEELGIDREVVYDAKRRILRRLRELRPLLDETW